MSDHSADSHEPLDSGSPRPPSKDLPEWIIKPFDGMAPGSLVNLKPYIPPRHGLLTFERLRLVALSLLVGGFLVLAAILASQPGALLYPDPPGLRHDVVTAIPTRSFFELTAISSSPSTRLMHEMSLDPLILKSWTNQEWELLNASSAQDAVTSNSYLYTSVQALKPQAFASQEFTQKSGGCTPFCQVSWAGISFENMTLALKAFDWIDQDNKSTQAGYSSLGFFNNGSAPAWSCISKLYPGDQVYWVTCLYAWDNLVTSTRIISQVSANQNPGDLGMFLIGQINTLWRGRRAQK